MIGDRETLIGSATERENPDLRSTTERQKSGQRGARARAPRDEEQRERVDIGMVVVTIGGGDRG